MDRAEAVVVGAGLIGAAVAYELVAYGVDTVVLERATGPAAGASGAGAGIIDTGYAVPVDSFEASMTLGQGRRWPEIFEALGIAYKTCGAVLVATESAQLGALGTAESLARERGIKLKAYDRGQIRNLEPHAKAVAGLLIPGEAITDPYDVVSRLLRAGPTVRYGSKVTSIEAAPDGAVVRCESGDLTTRFVINCAGLFSDEVARDETFSLAAERAECVVFPQEAGMLTDHIIFSLPIASPPRATIFPTIHGFLGAFASIGDQQDKVDWRSRADDARTVQAAAARLVPRVSEFTIVASWAGLRALGRPKSYIAEWSKRVPQMFNIAGIASSGLSAAFGLSAYVVDRCREHGLAVKARTARRLPAADPTFPWWQRRAATS